MAVGAEVGSAAVAMAVGSDVASGALVLVGAAGWLAAGWQAARMNTPAIIILNHANDFLLNEL
jgi:hypothetical protein